MAADPKKKKVVVNFQSVANAPKLRQSKFKIGENEKFAKNFGIDGQLVFNYASSLAWG